MTRATLPAADAVAPNYEPEFQDEIPLVRFTAREWRAIRIEALRQGYGTDPEGWCRELVRVAAGYPPAQ